MRTDLEEFIFLERIKAVSMIQDTGLLGPLGLYLCCWIVFLMAHKAGENPVRGVLGLRKRVRSTRLAWGVLGWRQPRPESDRSGDRVKRPAMKSSTTKGATDYKRERLPVRF